MCLDVSFWYDLSSVGEGSIKVAFFLFAGGVDSEGKAEYGVVVGASPGRRNRSREELSVRREFR